MNQLDHKSTESHKLFLNQRRDGNKYDCDLIPLFELQSVHYDSYVVNIQFTGGLSGDLPVLLSTISMKTVTEDQRFQKVWLAYKTIFFTLTIIILWWYLVKLHKLTLEKRDKTLLEKLLVIVGLTLVLMNAPIEYLNQWIDFPWMVLINNARNGLFLWALLSLWIVFPSEYHLDTSGGSRSSMCSYYCKLTFALIVAIGFVLFNSIEPIIQSADPFFTIRDIDSNLPLIFFIISVIFALFYIAIIVFEVVREWRTLSAVRTGNRRHESSSTSTINGRYKYLLFKVAIIALFTLIAMILTQVQLDHVMSDQLAITYTSAMWTLLLTIWNCHCLHLLIVYSQSDQETRNPMFIVLNALLKSEFKSDLTTNGNGHHRRHHQTKGSKSSLKSSSTSSPPTSPQTRPRPPTSTTHNDLSRNRQSRQTTI